MNDATYQHKLAEEAELWGTVAEQQAAEIPPDWRYHRALRQNVIMHTAAIDALLSQVQPGMNVLELGCGPGWLTLAMARRGAAALGLDISEKSIDIARSYYETVKAEVSGSVTYQVADLNTENLPAEFYDMVVAKGVLHHLLNLDQVIDRVYAALKPSGLFWVADTNGDEALPSVLVASALTFVLPTQVSYRDKLRGLLRFGLRAPGRVKASIQADGLSPFEGAGREHDWMALIGEHFVIERRFDHPAFTGYVTAQVALPDSLAIPLLKVMYKFDKLLVRLRILRNTGVILYARKGAPAS
jgi:2-polyprenyl-3-methyl-5-hydroxy-6-metoxy-1,4-benzoquinol methylase